jgi:hypothetical protein
LLTSGNFLSYLNLILLRWFENYLSDRNQRVVLQNCLSEVGNVKGGVPQWSVLGPKAFDISQNTAQLTSRLTNHYTIDAVEVEVSY